ncbi:MAG: hypothetical protein HRU38_24920 [Saccharospirillaceae bacterium]|nr:hypothetical protein [Saccharospirillaceae bacterium]
MSEYRRLNLTVLVSSKKVARTGKDYWIVFGEDSVNGENVTKLITFTEQDIKVIFNTTSKSLLSNLLL